MKLIFKSSYDFVNLFIFYVSKFILWKRFNWIPGILTFNDLLHGCYCYYCCCCRCCCYCCYCYRIRIDALLFIHQMDHHLNANAFWFSPLLCVRFVACTYAIYYDLSRTITFICSFWSIFNALWRILFKTSRILINMPLRCYSQGFKEIYSKAPTHDYGFLKKLTIGLNSKCRQLTCKIVIEIRFLYNNISQLFFDPIYVFVMISRSNCL